MSVSAALLAGGLSSRMGCDKAQLLIDGQPLWWRQWRKLRLLRCDRLMLSLRRDQKFARPPAPAIVVPDLFPECGPLGGVLSCLQQIELDGPSPRLLVLGIDLPLLPVAFLEDILFASQPGCGAVARTGDRFEPLCAVYPIEMLEIGRRLTRLGHTSMQGFIREGIAATLMVEITPRDYPPEIFTNLNTPDDVRQLTGEDPVGAF